MFVHVGMERDEGDSRDPPWQGNGAGFDKPLRLRAPCLRAAYRKSRVTEFRV